MEDKRRRITTRNKIGNVPRYPSLMIHWVEEEDLLGWTGTCQIWKDGNTKLECSQEHTVTVRQTIPMGGISIFFDSCPGGCWEYATFEGCRLDERDLAWAACWALLALQDKHRRAPFCLPEEPKEETK